MMDVFTADFLQRLRRYVPPDERDVAAAADEVLVVMLASRRHRDTAGMFGYGFARLFGPDGALKQHVAFANLITTKGDEFYTRAGAGVSALSAVSGMRLGTGTTAVAKSGAGAAIVTYVSASQRAIDGGFPTAAAVGSDLGWKATYQATWAAGVATASAIAEAVITNESSLTDVAGTASNTISRVLLSPTVNKGALDSLVISWAHTLLGA